MSAFVVNKAHIDALVRLAVTARHYGMTWYGTSETGGRNVCRADSTNGDAVGQMLVDACVASVSHRYPGDEPLPGPLDEYYREPFEWNWHCRIPSAIEGLKLLSCYEYQSCEHPGWESSEARAFCDVLRRHLICRLPGYSEAPSTI